MQGGQGGLKPARRSGRDPNGGRVRGVSMLTRAADYAVRVMVQLALLPAGTRVQRSALAETTGVPDSFLSKVLQGLVRARLVVSHPGVNGGFELARAAQKISLLEVVEAIDGPMALNVCLSSEQACDRQSWCAAHLTWREAQGALAKVLKAATIDRIARDSARRRSASEVRSAAGGRTQRKRKKSKLA
jgi:Rrf2 family protein